MEIVYNIMYEVCCKFSERNGDYMIHFWKHLLHGILWLCASEMLCLILAVSFAIIGNAAAIRIIALIFGVTAHILLIGSCAVKAAAEDAAFFRAAKTRTKIRKPLTIALILLLPAILTYILLTFNSSSVLMLNLFPLLNAPFIGIYYYLIGGAEPFSAVSSINRILMAFPPVLTAAAYLSGYYFRYLPEVSAHNTRSNLT